MADIQLREAAPRDVDLIFDIFCAAIRSYVEMEADWNDAREHERHLERFARQRNRLIALDGADVGYLSTAVYPAGTEFHPPCLYLHQLMVRPPFQSRGIGAACLCVLAAEARELQLPLRFRVLRVNQRALTFYLRNGCELVGESDTHFAMQLHEP